KNYPKDALVIATILKEMGVRDYEPRVVSQLLELIYRYVSDILDDAAIYSNHAQKKQLDADDTRLAIKNFIDQSFTSPPPRDFLVGVARQRNDTPLPIVQVKNGLRLPPERYCMSSANYHL
ncbi:uncharacterized protein TRIADDRAFT_7341, partial [Trichoplax adhaerens]